MATNDNRWRSTRRRSKGKRYLSTIEILKGEVIESKSGTMPIFVDDCDTRQKAILDLMNNPDVFKDDGFHWYLELENAVAVEICKRIRNGMVRQQSPNAGFSNRCHYQCINNFFTNLIVDFSLQPIDSNNVWANAHRRTLAYRGSVGIFDEYFNDIDFAGIGTNNAKQENLEIMLIYVWAENFLRAEGYYQCENSLNLVDRELSVDLISEVMGEFLQNKGYPFDVVSG